MELNYPIFEWDDDEADASKKYFFRSGKKPFECFNEVISKKINKCIIFFPREFEKCTEIYFKCKKIYEFKSASTISPIYLYDDKLLIAMCPLGGPASANLVEELSFVGINQFLACGSCGCLKNDLDTNDLFFIPLNAIRDEGLSYHYIPASRTVETNNILNKKIEKTLIKNNEKYIKSTIWTTDAMYRETPARIHRRIEEGAIGVDMECASLASVAKHYGYQFSCLLYFTDKIEKTTWQWRKYDKIQLRTKLLKLCIEALTK